MRARLLIQNIAGLFIALALLGIVLGEQFESLLFPILSGPRIEGGNYLPEPVISDVRWVGNGNTARLFWREDFCKRQNAILVGSGYTFWYFRSPEKPGIPVRVTNESRQTPFGNIPLPIGCLRIVYSATLPDDPAPERGDYLLSRVVYQSPHGFWWHIVEDFGTVVVPSPPPS